MCANAREWRCWNSIGVDCLIVGKKILAAITNSLYELDGFDTQFRELVRQAHGRTVGASADQWKSLDANERKLNREMDNLVAAMAELGPTPEIKLKHGELKERQQELAIERSRLTNATKHELQLPESVNELRVAFEKQAEGLAIESPMFGDLMRQLVPEIHIYLVRLLDGGHLMPRARVKINLAACVSDLLLVPELSELLTRVVTLDLFVPPQRERIREEAVRLAALGMEQREIATRLPERTFQAVVQKALVLDRLMKERGLASTYEVLDEPPLDYPKLRRHKHPRYQFKPIDGYERPAI